MPVTTSFTYGDPTPSPAIFTAKATLVGVSLGGAPSPVVPLDVVLPGGSVSIPYTTTISAVGGTSPYTFTVSVGTLPTGLSLSSAGVISGTPTVAGTSSFTILATDHVGATGSTPFSITIATASASGGNYGWFG